jgi:putative ABC transport system permease protein
MLSAHLTSAVRHLKSRKLYSAINIAGLTVGLACFILIAVFVRHELSYDSQWANADRIYRISRDFYAQPDGNGYEMKFATSTPGMAALLEQNFPQIETTARMTVAEVALSRAQDEAPLLETAAAADPEILDIFDFDWLEGTPAGALDAPFTAVLTESTARKYFGERDPIGATLLLERTYPVRVTGVIADLPDNTHFEFGLLMSLSSGLTVYGEDSLENNANWSNNGFYTYVLLEEGESIEAIQSQSADFFERRFREGSSQWTGFTALPVTAIHLSPGRQFEIRPPGSMATVYAFAGVGALILLIACINFMNLSTALATQRAKEVGVRKTAGAERSQVVAQFLGESTLLALIALVLAVALVEIALPAFSAFVEKDLRFDYLTDPSAAASLLGLALVVGIFAGAYPAFYLAAFNPARVLKGDVTRGAAGAKFRKGLVVVQFAISIALVIATAFVFEQRRFAQSIELGYNKDQIVMLDVAAAADFRRQWEPFKRRLLANAEVTHVTASSSPPGNQRYDSVGLRAEGSDATSREMNYMFVELDFFETYDIDILAGRAFSEAYPSDRTVLEQEDAEPHGTYLINALAARQFGWTPEEAVGKWMEITAGEFFRNVRGPIVGVTEDVHFRSVRSTMQPIFYLIAPERMFGGVQMLQQVSIRVTGRDLPATLDYIDAAWAAFFPNRPIARRFLDEDFQALYRAEEREGQILAVFSALAIFVACLGLFGLTVFATERRTKEIGVRKVMGATVTDIVGLFTGEFSLLVLAANVIAWPTAYLLMRRWLESFAYRIDIDPLVFVGSGLAALGAASLTVGAVAARAARAKPGISLRYE